MEIKFLPFGTWTGNPVLIWDKFKCSLLLYLDWDSFNAKLRNTFPKYGLWVDLEIFAVHEMLLWNVSLSP